MKKYMLQLSKNEIIDICGMYPQDFEKIEIQSDANFAFVNDPNYAAVQLFDVESNTVFVNSFRECEHYVNGGWNYFPNQINESDYHNFLSIFSLILVIAGLAIFRKLRIGNIK